MVGGCIGRRSQGRERSKRLYYVNGKGLYHSHIIYIYINTQNSMDNKVVVADDYIPQILWMKYFLESQGYIIAERILY